MRPEDLAHLRHLDRGAHAVLHLGPARQVDLADAPRLRAVRVQLDAVKQDLAVVDAEPRVERGAHRLEALDGDRAARGPRGAAVAHQLHHGDVEVAHHGDPRRPVIEEGELAAVRVHVAGRHLDRARAATGAVPAEVREVVAIARPGLGVHPPVGHLDAFDDQLAPQQPPQRHRDDDLARLEEGLVGGDEAFDQQVVHHEAAVEQPDGQGTEVHRPLEEVGGGRFRPLPEHRAELHAEAGDHAGGDDRDRDHAGRPGVSQQGAGEVSKGHGRTCPTPPPPAAARPQPTCPRWRPPPPRGHPWASATRSPSSSPRRRSGPGAL